jgi:anti-sigma regulatory factor (Ser/Thr protein kinase)
MDELMALDLRSERDAAHRAREALSSAIPTLGPAIRANAGLLVSELVSSSVRRVPETDAISLRVLLGPDRIRVEVRDPGPLFPPPTGRQSSGWSILHDTGPAGDPTGWGLYIVSRVASRWGITVDRGTEVWFELDLPAFP